MWSKKKPKRSGDRYLITLDGTVRQADLTEYPKGSFTWLILPSGTITFGSERVTAWQKEPKPYDKS